MIRNVAVILLYNSKKKILLQHRSDDSPRLPGYWAFFGGGIEGNETPSQTIIREADEELGYHLRKPVLVMVQELRRGYKGKMYVFLEPYSPSQKINLKEGKDLGWFSINETSELKMTDHDRDVLEYIRGKF